MGSKSSSSKMPDPSSYIPLVQEQARQNRINTSDPYGYTRYRYVPGQSAPSRTAVSATASRPLGSIGRQQAQSNRPLNQPVSQPALPSGEWYAETGFSEGIQPIWEQQLAAALNPDQFNQQAADATYRHAMSLLEPGFEQQQDKFMQTMANRGLPIDSEAYGTAFGNLTEAQNKARESAMLSSILQGRQAANEAYMRMAGLTSGGRAPGAPSVDVMGPASMAMQGNLADQQAQQGKKSNATGAAATMAAAYMMCDENIKHDKREISHDEILDKVSNLRVERWKYNGEEIAHIGPYAQQFKELFGLGDGKSIPIVDMFGILLSANKALKERLEALGG